MKNALKMLAMLSIILFQACVETEDQPEQQKVDLENPTPVANNGVFKAVFGNENYESNLNMAVLEENTAIPDMGNAVIFSAQITGSDTVSIFIQLTRDVNQLQVNQWYQHTATQFVTGMYRDSKTKKFGVGQCSVRFTRLDNTQKLLSGTFQFTADVFQLPSPVSSRLMVQGSFTDIQFIKQ
jgi:hypothetical protein